MSLRSQEQETMKQSSMELACLEATKKVRTQAGELAFQKLQEVKENQGSRTGSFKPRKQERKRVIMELLLWRTGRKNLPEIREGNGK